MSARPRFPTIAPGVLGNALVLIALLSVGLALSALQNEPWWPAPPRSGRWFAGAATLLAYLGACAWLLARHRRAAQPVAAVSTDTVRVAYASQTGFAHLLATRTAESLRAAGIGAAIQPLETLAGEDLREGRILFVISTTGEGDPPDHALGFVRRVMSQPVAAAGLHYAVLALGDREYAQFCGFGRQLDDWLRQHGAHPLFDRVDVDNADESALRHWQHHLGQLGGTTDLPDWDTPRYDAWTLAERRCLNPGSVGEPVFHITLRPPAGAQPDWRAGDIAEIGPRNSADAVAAFAQALGWDCRREIAWSEQRLPLGDVLAQVHLLDPDTLRDADAETALASLTALPHREYSIASIPQDGNLQLLVRRMRRPEGSLGLGSGWLCVHAQPGDRIALRIRTNANFHPPAADVPLILIGNGTGIAGLRAHLKARAAAGTGRNWLLFGERQAAHDVFFREDIEAWQASGLLERLDLAFSRDQAKRRYVQHALRAADAELRRWVEAGAAFYVCGSLDGMAPGVDAVLAEILGEDTVETLRLSGRYRRDVY